MSSFYNLFNQLALTEAVPNILFKNHFQYAVAMMAMCNADAAVLEHQVEILLSGLLQDNSHRFGPGQCN